MTFWFGMYSRYTVLAGQRMEGMAVSARHMGMRDRGWPQGCCLGLIACTGIEWCLQNRFQ